MVFRPSSIRRAGVNSERILDLSCPHGDLEMSGIPRPHFQCYRKGACKSKIREKGRYNEADETQEEGVRANNSHNAAATYDERISLKVDLTRFWENRSEGVSENPG